MAEPEPVLPLTDTLPDLRRVALVGNPNVGKTTVFNLLTGRRQKVANYPGVTVERKSGRLIGTATVEVVDLPGTYSLNPKSLDEQIAYDMLVGRIDGETPPDLVVCVVDATNLERNLYLVSQVMDLGLPIIVALNMMDAVRESDLAIDTEALGKALGLPIFLAVLVIVFQAVFSWAIPAMDLIEAAVAGLGTLVRSTLPSGVFTDLVVEGAIAGVGNVLIFLPQILLLFFFIGLMEDSGYMARTAFIMDRLMSRVGLSGGSVVPLLSSFACAIPGIMAARTLDNERDRIITIMVAPLMSCWRVFRSIPCSLPLLFRRANSSGFSATRA